jgi:protein-tyrosine kinase
MTGSSFSIRRRLMVTTEAPVLAQSMGQMHRGGRGGTNHAFDAQAGAVEDPQCPVKMLVLNKARYARTDGYYGYYGYGYGYGADSEQRSSSRMN